MEARCSIDFTWCLMWTSFDIEFIGLKCCAVWDELLVCTLIVMLQRGKLWLWFLILDSTPLDGRYALDLGATGRWRSSGAEIIGARLFSQSVGAVGLPGDVLLIGLTGIKFGFVLRRQVYRLNRELLILWGRRAQRCLTAVSSKILLLVRIHARRPLWALHSKRLHTLKPAISLRLFVIQHEPLIETLFVIHRYLLCTSRRRRKLHLHHTLVSYAETCPQRREWLDIIPAVNLWQDVARTFGIMVMHQSVQCLLFSWHMEILVLIYSVIWFLTGKGLLSTILNRRFKPHIVHRWRFTIPALICRKSGHR